jgi:hypothetical protein
VWVISFTRTFVFGTNFGFLYATEMVPNSLKPRMATYFEIGGGHTERQNHGLLEHIFLNSVHSLFSYTEVVICKYVSGYSFKFPVKVGIGRFDCERTTCVKP